ncbi:MAG: ABC transporter ATP-binding protein/permease [Clostridium sp.]|nr:ABC transporter ATP-binding protein/permease [Clostridium sp.]MCM1548325.1 ABC transporter ATP-binding protein/permease [Ruminococcus sp.]
MFKLWRFLKNHKKELILGPFFKLLEAVFELIVPLVMAKIIDVGIKNGDSVYVLKMCGVLVLLGVCGLGFALTCQYFAAKCAYGFGTELREALYRHINSFSHAEIDKFGTSSLTTRLVNDTNLAQNGVNMFIRLAVRAPFLIIGAAVMAMLLDFKLSIIFLVAAPLITAIIVIIMKKTVPMYKKIQNGLDRVSLLTRENLEGVRVIRAFSRQDEEEHEFNEASDDLAENSIAVGKISAILNPITFMIMNLSIVAILWFGGIRVDSGMLSQGEITAFVNYMTQILLALVVLANLVVIFTKAASSSARINEVFETEPTVFGGSKSGFDPKAPAIECSGLSFTYPGAGAESLKDISFTLQKGETLGIIGGTGSGKSTFANLIPHFYNVTEGTLKLFGTDVNDYSLDFLRANIGIVPQKTALFSGSIAENMRWAKPDASDNEIIKALKIAQAWDFVDKLPDGLDTYISQGGKNFSGGQRQRLTIARALVGEPPLVILDDSMSALDYATDLALRKALSEQLKDTTVIMISQRATTLKNADLILVLDDGTAAGLGTSDELLESCDEYKEIYNCQMK